MTDARHLDVRTYQRYLKKGVLTKEAYEASLSALPDLSEQAEFLDYNAQFQAEAEEEARTEAPAPVEPAPPGQAYPPATAAPPGSSALSATPPHLAGPGDL